MCAGHPPRRTVPLREKPKTRPQATRKASGLKTRATFSKSALTRMFIYPNKCRTLNQTSLK